MGDNELWIIDDQGRLTRTPDTKGRNHLRFSATETEMLMHLLNANFHTIRAAAAKEKRKAYIRSRLPE